MKLFFTKLLLLAFIFMGANNSISQIPGNSLRLKADENYISINDPNDASLNSNMTWEFWIYNRCENGSNSVIPISKGWCQASWSYYISIESGSGKLVFQKFDGGGSSSGCTFTFVEYASPLEVVPFNTWTHIGIVMSGSSIQFYKNGQPITTTLTSGSPFTGISNSGKPILIGAYQRREGNYILTPKANIDEVRIWHVARTASEILNSYQSQITGSETGLVAYYKLNETGSGANIATVNSAVGSSIPNGTTVGTAANLQFVNNDTILNTTSDCSSMPLSLLSFSAKREDKKNFLKWTTAQEINVDRFEIERSFNGTEYSSIGQLKAGSSIYTFNDNEIGNDIIYYRLKMIDNDGKFTYSKVVTLKMVNTSSSEIYPNPITSTATLKVKSLRTERVNVKIANSEGKILLIKTYNMIAGNNLIPLNTLNLTRGVYVIVISGQNRNEHLTFSKQ